MEDRAVGIVSGGMDSTVLAYMLADLHRDVWLLSFNYGQRHKKELTYAARTAEKLGVAHDIIDMRRAMQPLLEGSASALVSETVVPDGHYAQSNMAATVVPNRNMVMLAMATSAAVAWGASVVATAVHSGDHFIYPDCRPEFIHALNEAIVHGNLGFGAPGLHLSAPFVQTSKAGIVEAGARLGVPFEDTWSCYKGGARHCGRCGTCVERAEAFWVAQVKDPTNYADPEYWKTVTHLEGVR